MVPPDKHISDDGYPWLGEEYQKISYFEAILSVLMRLVRPGTS